MLGLAPCLRRLACALALALGVLAWSALVHAPPARADESADQLREELLRGTTTGDWNGTLKAVLEKPAEQVGTILGPLFTTPEHAARVDLLATVSAYLASHPVTLGAQKHVLLVEYVLRRARGDAAFVERLREPLIVDRATGRRPDWDRLLDHALALLRDAARSADDRAAALAFAAQEDGARAGEVVDALVPVAQRLRDGDGQASAERQTETQALLEALDTLLAYRFETLEVALPELERTQGQPFAQRLKYFSRLKSGADRDRALAVLHGREVIRRMESPAELVAGLSGTAFPYPELQRALLERAAALKPRAGQAWEEVFRAALERAREPDLVLRTLDLLAESGFGGGPKECCGRLAETVQRRLERAAPADPHEVRRRLVVALGDLASLEPVARQVSTVLARRTLTPAELPEVVELVRAAGRCPGVQVEDLRPFYDLTSFPTLGTAERDLLREQVARALGRDGVRTADPDGAAAALLGMLDGGSGWDRASGAKVREQAYRSLASYPSDAVIARLLSGAQATEPAAAEEAQYALEALGQMLGAGDEAARQGARALVLFLRGTRERSDVETRRATALKRLKDLPAGDAIPAELRAQARAAVREVLEAAGSEALRAQAARTAADLADAEALAPLIAWWSEQPQPPRTDLLRALFDAVVRAGPDGDARVAQGLLAVAKVPEQAGLAVDWADALAKSALRDGAPRSTLLGAQARVLVARADLWAADAAGEARRAEDLEGARTILTAVVQGARTPEEAEGPRRELVAVLERLASGLGESAEGVGRRVEAVAQAADSKDADVLRSGERLGREVLSNETLRRLLSAEEQAELERQVSAIRAALERSN